jgi:hypothetical protein
MAFLVLILVQGVSVSKDVKKIVLRLLMLTLSVLPFRLYADGYHLPNFYEDTILESWTKLKLDFGFPELPAGKTWSDLVQFGNFDKNQRFYTPMRKGTALQTVLTGVTIKLISVLKYSDPYNSAYDSPPWMQTAAGREKAVDEAGKVLQEIGFQVLPYLWQAYEAELRFNNGQRIAGIQVYRDAVRNFAIAEEDLKNLMRAKVPEFTQIEAELQRLVADFWKEQSVFTSAASKMNAQYGIKVTRLKELMRQMRWKDEDVKRKYLAWEEAETKVKAAQGQVPGEFFSDNNGMITVVDAERRLSDLMIKFGEQGEHFLRNQMRNPIVLVRQKVEVLLARIAVEKNKREPGQTLRGLAEDPTLKK